MKIAKRDAMYHMRQSPATLQQVATEFGISRERVRRLLVRYYGSAKVQGLLSAAELGRLAGCSQSYISKLKRRGVIQPAKVVGKRTLWKPETTATIIVYSDSHRCRLCNTPLPSNRWVYCSTACYKADRGKRRKKK